MSQRQPATYGYNNTASGYNHAAFGSENLASGEFCSIVLGYGNTSSGNYSTACGLYNFVTGYASTGVGYNNNVSANRAAAIGYNSTSSAYKGSAVGVFCTAGGQYSSAVGFNNAVLTLNSHLVGGVNFTTEDSNSCVMFGLMNNQQGAWLNWETGSIYGTPVPAGVVGSTSIALGIQNTTSGYASVAVGLINTASGTYSVAAGYDNTTSDTNASAIGNSNTASNSQASAIGNDNNASGQSSSAIGSNNTASNTFASAMGYSNIASNVQASAIGYENSASGEYSSAIGCANNAVGDHSSAFGYGAVSRIQFTTNIAGPIIIRKDNAESAPLAQFRFYSGAETVIFTTVLDLTSNAGAAITLPAGSIFIPSEVGLIVTTIDTMTVQPTVIFGDEVTGADLLTPTLTTNLTAVNYTQSYTPLNRNGHTALNCGTFGGATATAMTGRFYWKGILLETQ